MPTKSMRPKPITRASLFSRVIAHHPFCWPFQAETVRSWQATHGCPPSVSSAVAA